MAPLVAREMSVAVLGCFSNELVCEVKVNSRSDVMDVKAQIERFTGIVQAAQGLFFQERRLANCDELGFLLEEASPTLGLVKVDPEWVKICTGLEFGTLQLQDVDEEHQADPSVVLAAVCRDGMALQHAAEPLRALRHVVLPAVRQNGLALQFATEEMQDDLEVVLVAVEADGLALEFASEVMQCRREVVIRALRQNGFALRFAADFLHEDREVVLEAVKSDGRALSYAAPALKHDREIVVAACADNNECTVDIPEELRHDPEVLRAWMQGIRVGGDMGGVVAWGIDIQKTFVVNSMEMREDADWCSDAEGDE